MGLFGFGKKARKVVSEVKKMEKRDDVEATVWGCMAIAFADGDCSAEELSTLEKTVAAKPAFASFSGEITSMTANAKQQFEASPRSGKAEAMRQLREIAGTPQGAYRYDCILMVREEDGDICPFLMDSRKLKKVG